MTMNKRLLFLSILAISIGVAVIAYTRRHEQEKDTKNVASSTHDDEEKKGAQIAVDDGNAKVMEVNEKEFIYFGQRACDKSDRSVFAARSKVKRALKCERICKRKTWCLGYEFRLQTEHNDGYQCALFKATPNPKEARKKNRVCAQLRWRSEEPSSIQTSNSPTDISDKKWTFLVFADTHAFDTFSWNSLKENKRRGPWREIKRVLTSIRDKFGGELVLLPGDQVSYGSVALQTFRDHFGLHLSPQEAVYKAAVNSHKTTRALFEAVGYDKVLATVGDHDIGGNEGFVNVKNINSKLFTLPSHRQGFGDGFIRNENGEYLFDQLLGGIPSRPLETEYENTTYAYVHHSTLFITVDAFELVGDGTQDYLDREYGLGGEGAVTCTVSGDHLSWFKSILSHGRDSENINHIFVQAHLPIIQPVQKVDTSGQFFDRATESDFWNLMNEYGVDIYFAGDVHANTATRSSYDGSNLIQIVSRGIAFNNVLTVDVSQHIIDVKIYNEYGDKRIFNEKYEASGQLTIDKSSGTMTEITSSGMLELLDTKSEIISFDFEEVFPLGTRQVPSLGDRERLMVSEVTIRNEVCKESMFNKGGFGAQYDAQLCNIALVEGRQEGGNAGSFNEQSRFGVYGTGPFSGGNILSMGLWIRTTEAMRKMVLVHYANYWGYAVQRYHEKDSFTLILDNGVPVINLQPIVQLKPSYEMNLADGSWHHIGISMPSKSCMVSELEIYVDGQMVSDNVVTTMDRHIFYTTTGRLSLGGFGYSNHGYEDAYPDVGPFIGTMDDFVSFARPLQVRTDFPFAKHHENL